VDQPSSRFFCHQCSGEIRPVMPAFTCPDCDSGFIEEISPELEEERRETSSSDRSGGGGSAFEDLFDRHFGRQFLSSLGALDREFLSDGSSSSSATSSDDPNESGVPNGAPPRMRSPVRLRSSRDGARVASLRLFGDDFRPPRTDSGDPDPNPNPFLQDMIANILQNLTQGGGGGGGTFLGGIPITVGGPGGAMGGFPMNMFQIHGNPGDYAWGSGGLDAVISQLLNQLDSSGAPPAPRETIDQLPKVKITQQQVDKKLQCSVCMDDYILGETVHKLPCDHLFHENCIVPWLELHDTCPVCRKGLNEGGDDDDEDHEGNDDDGSGDGGGSGGRRSSAGLEGLMRGSGGNINIIFSNPGGDSGGSGGSVDDPLDHETLPTMHLNHLRLRYESSKRAVSPSDSLLLLSFECRLGMVVDDVVISVVTRDKSMTLPQIGLRPIMEHQNRIFT